MVWRRTLMANCIDHVSADTSVSATTDISPASKSIEALSNNNSSEEDNSHNNTIKKEGVLHKWTNYISGWQPRWFILHGIELSYSLSESDHNSSRGSLSLTDVIISVNPSNDVEFTIFNNSASYYLRASSRDIRKDWIIALGSAKAQMLIPNSIPVAESFSMCSGSGGGGGGGFRSDSNHSEDDHNNCQDELDGLDDKATEIKTYGELLRKQVARLQSLFLEVAAKHDQNEDGNCNNNNITSETSDLRDELGREAMVFRATNKAMSDLCNELFNEQEALWRRRVEHEKEKRAQVEFSLGVLSSKHQELKNILNGNIGES